MTTRKATKEIPEPPEPTPPAGPTPPEPKPPAPDAVSEIKQRLLDVEQRQQELSQDKGDKLGKKEFEERWEKLCTQHESLSSELAKLIGAKPPEAAPVKTDDGDGWGGFWE